jgi:hypothetical protein
MQLRAMREIGGRAFRMKLANQQIFTIYKQQLKLTRLASANRKGHP